MTQVPPGWYLDPTPPPGRPPALRWWDGSSWTEHLAPVPAQAAPTTSGRTTPDGAWLASWWQRVGATLIDGVVTTALTVAAGLPFLHSVYRAFRRYFVQAVDAAQAGRPAPGQATLMHQIQGPTLALGAISLLVTTIYSVGFLKTTGATPGKLLLGLRVRLRETPGPLGWATVWKHWLGQYAFLVLSLVPYVGSVFALYSLLDSLWPLWDPNRQAIHDRVAGTNVVVHRT